MKKIIALFLTLLMILTSVNVSYAATTTETVTDFTVGTIRTTDVLNDQIFSAYDTHIGFINYDVTQYLPKLYLANSVKLNVKSTVWSAAADNKFSLEIIPDSAEVYTDYKHNYKQAVAGGVLSDGVEIFPATVIRSNPALHTTDDIKAKLIEALESGDNNKFTIRLVLAAILDPDGGDNVGIQAAPELVIEFDDEVATDTAYYEEILKSFDLEEKASIDLDNITSDFILPTFYKGSNITWTSDKANITINSDGVASVVKPADNDEKVTLTATLSYKDGSPYEKTFEANVIKKSALEKLADNFNSTYKVSDEDYNAITKDLKLDKTFEGATISWKSSNINAVHPVTGKIIPSVSEDTTVSLTPTISLDGTSMELPSIKVTLKKYEGKTISKISNNMALTYYTNWSGNHSIAELRLYVSRGTKDTAGAYGRYVPYIQFDISEIKDTVYYADSMYLNLYTSTVSGAVHNDEECYKIYLVKNNDWDDNLTYDSAAEKGMNPGQDSGADEYEIYSSPVGKITDGVLYKTTDILPYVKDYIKNNPDETKISFKIFTPCISDSGPTFAFCGTGSGDTKKPSIEVRYNFETPGIQAVKNSDGTFSAVIKSNEAVSEKYTLYFASYTTDNTLVGLYPCPVNSLAEGATKIDADAEKFLTNGATKIKCILLKGDTLTPACKNGEVPN